MDGVSFLLKLVDQMSGPARAVADSLKAVRTELEALDQLTPFKLAAEAGASAVRATRAPKSPAADLANALPLAPLKLVNGELEVMKQQLRDDKLAVTNLSASLRQLKQAEVANLPAIAQVTKELQAKKNALADVQAQLVASGNASRFGSEGTNRLTTTLRELAEAAGGSGITGLAARLQSFKSNAGNAAGAFEELTGVSGKAALAVGGLAVAAVGAALAVYKLVAAVGDLVFSGAKLAIDAAEAKGDTLDMLEAMLGTQQAADGVYSQITAMTQSLAVSQAGVQASAQALAAAGIENKEQLVAGVKAIAQVDSVIKGAGGKIQSIIERATAAGKFKVEARKLVGTGVQVQKLVEEIARRTGKGVKAVEKQLKDGKIAADVGISALTAVIDKKFGELAKKQALDFPAQLQRLRDNFTKLFDGVDTAPFLEAFSKIVELFSDSTASGQAMKEVLTGAFNAVFRVITAVEPYAKTFLKGLVIIALQVAIAFKPLIKSIREAFGGEQQQGPLDLAKAMSAVGVILGALVSAFVAALPDIRAFITTVQILAYPFLQVARGIAGVVALLSLFTVAAGIAITWMVQLGTKAFEAGKSVVTGLIDGIKQGASRLIDSVKTMGQQALSAFKGVFGIASPSKVMMQMGGHLSTGLALGIQRTAPVANDNMRDMLAVPPARSRGAGGDGAVNKTVTVNVEIHMSPGTPADQRQQLMDIAADVFEQAANAA